MKHLRTQIFVFNKYYEALKILGYNSHSRQLPIICKCKGLRDGNEKCSFIMNKVFEPKYTSETYNENIIEMLKETDIIFEICSNKYVTIEQVLSVIKDMEKNNEKNI